MNFDEQLRSALRRREPPRDLLPGVRARLARPRRRPLASGPWLPALAAVIVLAVGLGVLQWRGATLRRQAQARNDARQLTAALHLASRKLAHVRAQVVGGAYR